MALLEMAGTAAAALGATVAALSSVSESTSAMSGRAQSSMVATVSPASVNLLGMSGRASASLNATLLPPALSLDLSGKANAALVATVARLLQSVPLPAIQATITAKITRANLSRSNGSGLTVFDAAREVYQLWKIEITDPRQITFARERVLAYINTAVQTMHARAHLLDYFTREPITVTVPGAASSVDLPDAVQVVRGPVKLSADSVPLRMLGTQTEIDNFVAYYYGDNPAPSEPRAYYVDSSRQGKPDSVKLVLHVSPPPTDDTALILHVSLEPPRYDVADIFASTPLQVPAQFAETIFWPLLKYAAAGDTMFKAEELRADITKKYEAAAFTLGLLNPPPPEGKPAKAAPPAP